ncbi:hypothetical protein L218DRAFT_999727 [Marasmius fiardii PR-910]|nr:hypothetical protein L218DRAFT_999727 [Marasmius fiardii PR-910]
MSEYWVSKKRYYCKYCEIYIADDAPSRQQHENGLRHKGNRDRFIRGLYKEGEKRKKDQEEEKREMARIESAAQAAFSQDVAGGRARAETPAAPSSSGTRKPPTKPADPYANYSTAASLGFTDPDAERIAAEHTRRQTQGVAGEWEVVEEPSSTQPVAETTVNAQKRPAETPVDPEDTRHFKLQKRTIGTGLGQIYDPGIIKLKPRKKETEEPEVLPESSQVAPSNIIDSSEPPTKTDNKPKWTKIQWKRAEDKSVPITLTNIDAPSPRELTPDGAETHQAHVRPTENEHKTEAEDFNDAGLKLEDDAKSAVPVARSDGKQEGDQVSLVPVQTGGSSGGLFRKRKKPNTGNGGRRET